MKKFIAVLKQLMPHIIFWGWNALFLAFVYFGLLSIHFIDLFSELADGLIPWNYVATAAAVLAIPPAFTLLGFLRFRNDPRRLLGLFYGVEAPLLTLALARLYLVRQMNPGLSFLFWAMTASTAFYFVGLLRRGPTKATALPGDCFGLLTAGYLASIGLFWTIPLSWMFVKELLSFGWVGDLFRNMSHLHLFSLLGLAFFLASATLVLAMPAAVIALYGSRWFQTFKAASARLTVLGAAGVSALVVSSLATGFVRLNQQRPQLVLERLAEAPKTDAERRTLLDDASEIQEQLLKVYLARYRYAGSRGDAREMKQLVREAFSVDPETGDEVQEVYNGFVTPFFYQGNIHSDAQMAARLYAANFDQSIQVARQEEILQAHHTTVERSRRQASLLDVAERRVHLVRQDVVVTEQGPAASVEIHEQYNNLTHQDIEVFRYFSLPDSAVVTGLWLGTEPEKSKAFRFRVSTRGAAQEVYKAEVRRRVDPALLEQVGPRQYRLRVYPVPRKGTGMAYLWVRYQTLSDDGRWPLPRLAQERNVYADRHTERTLNGEEVDVEDTLNVVGALPWMPAWPEAHIDLASSEWQVDLTPEFGIRAIPVTGTLVPQAPQRLAVVVDRSYSMRAHADELQRNMESLRAKSAQGWSVDLYLSSSEARGDEPRLVERFNEFDPSALTFMGGMTTQEALRQFAELRRDRAYSAVILLTDGNSNDVAQDGQLAAVGAPLWLIHAGKTLPPFYDDGTLDAIQSSGGGVATSLAHVVASLALAERYPDTFVGTSNHMAWVIAEGPARSHAPESLTPIAARQMVRAAVRHLDTTQLAVLDQLHGLAKRHEIVTPYSSFIVLVNKRQHKALDDAEKKKDRFDREVEDDVLADETTSLTATPEPEEWALIILAALMLLAFARQREALPWR